MYDITTPVKFMGGPLHGELRSYGCLLEKIDLEFLPTSQRKITDPLREYALLGTATYVLFKKRFPKDDQPMFYYIFAGMEVPNET